MRSAFCTTAPSIGPGHGGGASSYWELAALKDVTNLRQTIKADFEFSRYYPGNAFMTDYLGAMKVEEKVDVAIFNGGPWSATMRMLSPGKSIVDCPAHDLALSIEEFKRMGQPYPGIHMTVPYLWTYFSMWLREADIIMTQSKRSIQALEDLGLALRRVEVVPGGVVVPAEVSAMPDAFRVGYVGVVGPDKGLIYLIDAWGRLGLKDAMLVMAGEDTDKLDSLIGENADKADYNLMGYIPDTKEVYENITVYCQPSVTEGFGLPVLEAMAHGKPVIVSEGAGASELIEDGVDGFVVPIRDVDAIADRILYFYRDASAVERMGKAARKKAEQYTWLRAKSEYERLILE